MKIDLTEARVQVSGVLTQRKKIVKPTMNWSAPFSVNSNIHKFYLLISKKQVIYFYKFIHYKISTNDSKFPDAYTKLIFLTSLFSYISQFITLISVASEWLNVVLFTIIFFYSHVYNSHSSDYCLNLCASPFLWLQIAFWNTIIIERSEAQLINNGKIILPLWKVYLRIIVFQ